ncbi:MAG: hypothetical protein QOJ76_941 [Acidobacteriota bacterium]|jgi:hypothetical protein|nr:hypothetical protein [Acidobacteriota bacterium]
MFGLTNYWRDFNFLYERNKEVFEQNEWRRHSDASYYVQKRYPSKLKMLYIWVYFALGTSLWWSVFVVTCAWNLRFPMQRPTSHDFAVQYEFWLLMTFLWFSSFVMFVAYFKYKVYGLRAIFLETLIRIFLALILALIAGAAIAFFVLRSR